MSHPSWNLYNYNGHWGVGELEVRYFRSGPHLHSVTLFLNGERVQVQAAKRTPLLKLQLQFLFSLPLEQQKLRQEIAAILQSVDLSLQTRCPTRQASSREATKTQSNPGVFHGKGLHHTEKFHSSAGKHPRSLKYEQSFWYCKVCIFYIICILYGMHMYIMVV